MDARANERVQWTVISFCLPPIPLVIIYNKQLFFSTVDLPFSPPSLLLSPFFISVLPSPRLFYPSSYFFHLPFARAILNCTSLFLSISPRLVCQNHFSLSLPSLLAVHSSSTVRPTDPSPPSRRKNSSSCSPSPLIFYIFFGVVTFNFSLHESFLFLLFLIFSFISSVSLSLSPSTSCYLFLFSFVLFFNDHPTLGFPCHPILFLSPSTPTLW